MSSQVVPEVIRKDVAEKYLIDLDAESNKAPPQHIHDAMMQHQVTGQRYSWLNRFRDIKEENAFQLWTRKSYDHGRRMLAFVIILHLIIVVSNAVKLGVASNIYKLAYTTKAEYAHWWYLIVALPFIGSKWKKFPKNLAEFFNVHWKWIVAITIFMLVMGFTVRASYFASVVKTTFQSSFELSFADSCPSYNLTSLLQMENDILPFINEIDGATVIASATLFITIGQGILVAMEVDFMQVLFCSLFSGIGLIVIAIYWGIHTNAEACFLVLIAFVTLLEISRNVEHSRRDSFLTHRKAAMNNMELRNKLTVVVKELVAHAEYNDNEREIVSNALEVGEGVAPKLQACRIPLEHLQLLSIIGSGGFGEVIKCMYFGTEVVLKRMHRSQITEDNVKLFAKEIVLMAKIRHPSIVQFFGATWNTFSNIGFVLEYVERGDLFGILHDTNADVTWSDPLYRIAVDTARGIAYLHANGIVHRDLKSLNILVSTTFGAKICDFGLSTSLRDMKKGEKKSGTLFWTAPELLVGGEYTYKADCYAFGIILTEIVSRKIPYDDKLKSMTDQQIMHLIIHQMLRPNLPSNISLKLQKLINDCLLSNPEDRPSMARIIEKLGEPEIIEFEAEENWQIYRNQVHRQSNNNIKEENNENVFDFSTSTLRRITDSTDDLGDKDIESLEEWS